MVLVGTDLNADFLHFEDEGECWMYFDVEITKIHLPFLVVDARSKGGFVNFVYISFRLVVLKQNPCVES